jgi:hypothetical protein
MYYTNSQSYLPLSTKIEKRLLIGGKNLLEGIVRRRPKSLKIDNTVLLEIQNNLIDIS